MSENETTPELEDLTITLCEAMGLQAPEHWRLDREKGVVIHPRLQPAIHYILTHPEVYLLIVEDKGGPTTTQMLSEHS